MIGLNVAGKGEQRPADIAKTGAKIARFVLYPDSNITDWLVTLRLAGVQTMGVLARESSTGGNYGMALRNYRDLYHGGIDYWQIGNEADHNGESSWTLTPAALNDLLTMARTTLGPTAYVLAAAMTSGDQNYLRRVDLALVNAIAINPYGQRPWGEVEDWADLPGNFGRVNDLIDRYAAVAPGKDLWVTEIGLTTAEVNEPFQAFYLREMLPVLAKNTRLKGVIWFCYQDWTEKFGLVRKDGSIKPALNDFTIIADRFDPLPVGSPVVPVPPRTYFLSDAVRAVVEARGWTALSQQTHLDGGLSVTLIQTAEGPAELHYWASTGRTYLVKLEAVDG